MADREKAIRILEGNYKSFVLRHNGELLTVNELIELLKAQEPTKFQIKTTISNVNIPKDVDEEQFFAVLSQQYAALAKLYGEDVPTYSPS